MAKHIEKVEAAKWYSLDNILKHDTPYYFILGQRSNGKTYSLLKYALLKYLNKGERAVYVRRYDTDINRARARRVALQIEEVMHNEKITQYDGCVYSSDGWYLTKNKVVKHRDGSTELKAEREAMPFLFSLAMNNMEHDKGGNMNTNESNITTIIFDEIVTRMRYLPDEVSLFFDTVSTIKRRKTNLKIFMLANTVSKFCPYFETLEISFTPLMKQNTIKENAKGNVTVERTEDNAGDDVDMYFDFDNKTIGMITHGKWEIAEYPKIGTKWERKEVMLDIFLKYNGQIIHGDVVSKDGNPFIFFYPKYDNIHDESKDIIYSDKEDYRRNWHKSLLRGDDDYSKYITQILTAGKVFYSDNDTGEILRNFIIQNYESISARYRNA